MSPPMSSPMSPYHLRASQFSPRGSLRPSCCDPLCDPRHRDPRHRPPGQRFHRTWLRYTARYTFKDLWSLPSLTVVGMTFPTEWKNRKCSKPPTSYSFTGLCPSQTTYEIALKNQGSDSKRPSQNSMQAHAISTAECIQQMSHLFTHVVTPPPCHASEDAAFTADTCATLLLA